MKVSECIFCNVEQNNFAPIVYTDEFTIAFMDPRQANPGHTLIIPKMHFNDVRELDFTTGGALMRTLTIITQAISACFPNEGISIWHSIGPAAFQEVHHLHLHVHPRRLKDNLLKVYPKGPPKNSPMSELQERANILTRYLKRS